LKKILSLFLIANLRQTQFNHQHFLSMSTYKMYAIPERFRKTENLHILFWLVKDMSWAMLWKPLGIFMIIPTITVALLITWQTRKLKAELFHNLAIVFWITANAYWMIVEFLGKDDVLRIYTIIPFSIGLIFISSYYLLILPKEKQNQKMITINVEVSETTLQVAGVN